MFEQIKQFYLQHLTITSSSDSEETIQTACAALLIEMMHIDDELRPEEQKSIMRRLNELFALAPEQIETLIELADKQRAASTDYFQFTHLINQEFSHSQKIRLIESLWRVAFADGYVDDYEEYLVRKIADLIYVSHTDFIMAKNRIKGLVE